MHTSLPFAWLLLSGTPSIFAFTHTVHTFTSSTYTWYKNINKMQVKVSFLSLGFSHLYCKGAHIFCPVMVTFICCKHLTCCTMTLLNFKSYHLTARASITLTHTESGCKSFTSTNSQLLLIASNCFCFITTTK